MITLKHAAGNVAPVLYVAAMMLYANTAHAQAPPKGVDLPRSSPSPALSLPQSSSSTPRWPNHSPHAEWW